ncbi:MAG: hypothetical protein LBF90_03190 [Prevotellaceae bacterium]|jgi:hypothetical protein|nr:hypothetical protein [Prevotellaceae bacterium]
MKTTPDNYTEVGRLTAPIAKEIHRKAAYIYINRNYLRHIENDHPKELNALGIDAITLVRLVVNQYNRIYKGSGDSLLLVVYNGRPKAAAIELNWALKDEFYEVKTATIMKKDFLERKTLLWPLEDKK